MKAEWNLSVIYQGLEDPAYEADVKAFEEVVKAVENGDLEYVETKLYAKWNKI